MSSFLLDANALVYWAYPGSPYHEAVSIFLESALEDTSNVYVLSSSLNEVYYALHSHYMTESDARDSIRDIAEFVDLVDLTGPLVFTALDSDEPDYEDGLIRAAAEALQVDVIVTYDKKAFSRSTIPAVPASDAMELISQAGKEEAH